jgi:pimeloyl-ACP methyl ester carboxylesterase
MSGQLEPIRRTSRRGLRYAADGTGPAVLLVHGWCLDRQVWMYLEQALIEAGHHVITPDLAGYGESSNWPARRSLSGHAHDVTDLLDELDVEQAVLVGFAFGAAVVFSAEDYRRVGALVSLAMPSASTAPYGRMRGAITKDWPLFAARSARAILSESASEETRDWLARIYGDTSIGSALAGLEILESFEPGDLTKRWSVPSFFVHGSADPIVPASVSQACAAQLGGEYIEVPTPAHLLVIEEKQRLLEIVQEAIGSVTAGDRS